MGPWGDGRVTNAADQWRLAPVTLGEAYRRGRASFARALGAVRPYGGRAPERLLIVPPDLRTSDPTVATDIYSGHYGFAGRVVSTGGRSPFDVEPPTIAWAEVLYGFSWLRHLRAAETALASANARALVADYLQQARLRSAPRLRARVTARRLVSMLSHSSVVLKDADYVFYRRFMRGLARDATDLSRVLPSLVGEEQLLAALALCFAGLCMADADRFLRRGARALDTGLDRQILPDGGHVGRSPAVLVELLTDLLPLRQAFAARAVEAPAGLNRAIDRMMPMLRLFRHGDGSLALFNGMGLTFPDLVATLLAYDEARASPIQHAPHSGYERMEAGPAVLVMDTGTPPPPALSREAHAGTLAFELSAGAARIVVNCGVPRGASPTNRRLARVTAAHSTLAIGDISSSRFAAPLGAGEGGPFIAEGPTDVRVERRASREGAIELTANHDGYVRPFGLAHERSLRLAPSGDRLDGRDSLIGEGPSSEVEAAIRFHLHPSVKASRVGDGRTVMLVLGNGEAWSFETDAPVIAIEDSVFFAATDGIRRTEQIVLPLTAATGTRVRWSFSRLGHVSHRPGRAEAREPDLFAPTGTPAKAGDTPQEP